MPCAILKSLVPVSLCLQGFYAKPVKAADGTLNMMVWEVGIPGKQGVSERGHVYSRPFACCSALYQR